MARNTGLPVKLKSRFGDPTALHAPGTLNLLVLLPLPLELSHSTLPIPLATIVTLPAAVLAAAVQTALLPPLAAVHQAAAQTALLPLHPARSLASPETVHSCLNWCWDTNSFSMFRWILSHSMSTLQ